MSNKINEICKAILTIDDEEIQQMQKTINDQKNYVHPLRGASQRKFNQLVKDNQKVLNALKATKQALIESGKNNG